MRLRGRALNPVLGREVRERLRTRRATVVIVGYLVVLALVLYVVYRARVNDTGSQFDPFAGPLATQAASIGRTLFETVLTFMLALVLFIVPAVTADAFTGERERQTLVTLQVTLLRARSIVLGKLLTSLAFVTLLVVASLPLMSISFVTGGVTVGQVARGIAAVLATAAFAGCVALACSSIASRTSAALVMTFGMLLLFVVGSALGYFSLRVFDDDDRHPPLGVLVLNPFFAVADAVGGFDAERSWSIESPLEPMRRLIAEREGSLASMRFVEADVVEVVNGRPVEQARPRPPDLGTWERAPFWLRSFGALAAVSALCFVLATLRLRTPSNRAAA